MNENDRREHTMRLELQQQPGAQIIKDYNNLSGQPIETREVMMETNHGKDWREKLKKAQEANANK